MAGDKEGKYAWDEPIKMLKPTAVGRREPGGRAADPGRRIRPASL